MIAAVAVGVVLIASSATASFPGRNGRIAFARFQADDTEIYTMRRHGGDVRQLTDAPGNSIFSDWSPDGRRILFDSDRVTNGCTDQACNVEVFIINADGSGLRRLTHRPGFDGDPVWAPGGRTIAFTSDRDGDDEIYTMRLDGSHLRQLTHNRAADWTPDWSIDGRIAFTSNRGRGEGKAAVFTMRADGTQQRRITPLHLNGGVPDWAPGGKRLAFASNAAAPGTSKIFTVNADGSGIRRLTNPSEDQTDFFPSWSPDGRRITFSHGEPRNGEFNIDIYVMGTRGHNVTRLTRGPGFDFAPDWGSLP